MIPWADKLRSHPAYVQTAIAAAQVRPTLFISLNNQDQNFTSFSPQLYVNIHDDPSLAKAPTTSCVIFTNSFNSSCSWLFCSHPIIDRLTDAEKKAKKKAQKAAAQQRQREEAKKGELADTPSFFLF